LEPNVDTWKFSCNWVIVDVSFYYSSIQLICLFVKKGEEEVQKTDKEEKRTVCLQLVEGRE